MIFTNHSVFLEKNELSLPIFICVKSESFLHVVLPIAFVPGAIRIVKDTVALSNTVDPISFVPVTNVLSLTFGLEPNVHAPALLMVVFPFSDVFLSNVGPIHRSFTFLLVILPFALKIVS